MNELGVFLHKSRKAAGMTQAYVAEQLGLSRTSYTKYETGRVIPNIVKLLKIAKLLNVPCVVLLEKINLEFDIDAPLR